MKVNAGQLAAGFFAAVGSLLLFFSFIFLGMAAFGNGSAFASCANAGLLASAGRAQNGLGEDEESGPGGNKGASRISLSNKGGDSNKKEDKDEDETGEDGSFLEQTLSSFQV